MLAFFSFKFIITTLINLSSLIYSRDLLLLDMEEQTCVESENNVTSSNPQMEAHSDSNLPDDSSHSSSKESGDNCNGDNDKPKRKRKRKKRSSNDISKRSRMEPGELSDSTSNSDDEIENNPRSKTRLNEGAQDAVLLVSDSDDQDEEQPRNDKWAIDLTCESPPRGNVRGQRPGADQPPGQHERTVPIAWADYKTKDAPAENDDDSDDCIIESVDLTALKDTRNTYDSSYSDSYTDDSYDSFQREGDAHHDSDSEEYRIDSRNSTPSPGLVKDHQILRAKQAELINDRENLMIPRTWKEVGTPGPTPDDCTDFTIASYNILAQNLLDNHLTLYRYCEPSQLFWNFRKLNILDEIGHHWPDILCLQEVHGKNYADDMKENLKQLGYDGLFKHKTGTTTKDGCALLYKTEKFDLVRQVPIEYKHDNIDSLDRDQVGIAMMLKPKGSENDEQICVATTHLLWNSKRGDVKLAQLIVLLCEIDKIAFKGFLKDNKPDYYPIILAGDFNSLPQSDLYRFISRGYIPYSNCKQAGFSGQANDPSHHTIPTELMPPSAGMTTQCQYVDEVIARKQNNSEENGDQNELTVFKGEVSHMFNFKSVYDYEPQNGVKRNRIVTTSNMGSHEVVDYIWHTTPLDSENDNSNKLKLIGQLQLYNNQNIQDLGGIPNGILSSDHTMLMGKFRFKIK